MARFHKSRQLRKAVFHEEIFKKSPVGHIGFLFWDTMRSFFLIFAMALSLNSFADEYLFALEGSVTYDISVHNFYFHKAQIYKTEKNKCNLHIGTVEKLNHWTRGYAFKIADLTLASHSAYFYSLGSLFDRFKQYEVTDEDHRIIGFIEGAFDADTTTEICFNFYREDRELFAKATLNEFRDKLTITAPDGQILITARKYFKGPTGYFSQSKYHWNVKKETDAPFTAYFLWPFMAFISEIWWYSPSKH